jgi:hypothetical protein
LLHSSNASLLVSGESAFVQGNKRGTTCDRQQDSEDSDADNDSISETNKWCCPPLASEANAAEIHINGSRLTAIATASI